MNELILIKLLIFNKDYYVRYIKYINKDYYYNNYNDLYRILNTINYIYTNNISISTIDDFKALFFTNNPSLKKSEVEAFEIIFNRLASLDVSSEIIDKVLEGHRTRYVASKLAEVAWDTAKGNRTILELSDAFREGMQEAGTTITPDESDQIEFVTDDLDTLLDRTYGSPGLKWKLKTLRVMMGSLRKGNFGFVFSRPETGKTTFLASQGVHFASQLEQPYLHFNNEESGDTVKLRYIQAALGKSIEDINKNRKKALDDFLKITKGNIKLVDRPSLTKQEIEKICEKINPGMIIFDSIDKIKGFTEDRDDLVYKKIYAWARELSKQYGPVIGVCHASAGAEGKEWLEMDDVAYAKTAKQGEADWILGIGRSFDQGKEFVRSFYLPKNKLMGDEDSIEEFRHGKVRVLIKPESAQYEDIQFKDEVSNN